MKPTSPKQPPADDRGRVHPVWRHQRDYTPVISVPVGLGTFVVHREIVEGTDLATMEPVTREILTYSDGNVQVVDTNDDTGVTTPGGVSNFAGSRPVIEYQYTRMHDTDLGTGEVTEFTRVVAVVTNPDETTTYRAPVDMAVDLSAPYTPSGAVDLYPTLVRITKELTSLTGALPVSLTPHPHARYAEIYIEDANIRWTQDGSIPSDNNGEQERAGTTVQLYGAPALAGFRALTIDSLGNMDPTLTANLTVTYYNRSPDQGPFA